MKMAAAEALWEPRTRRHVALHLGRRARGGRGQVRHQGARPHSVFLAYNRFEGDGPGHQDLESYEQQYGPGATSRPFKWTYWTFRMMIGAGIVLLFLGHGPRWPLFGVVPPEPRLLAVLVPAIALPTSPNSAGWIFTEMGRQPWIVFGPPKTAERGLAHVTAAESCSRPWSSRCCTVR